MINLPDAAGYVFAISYQNDLSKVTLENLVIFSVRYKCAFYSSFPDLLLMAAA